MLSRSDHNSSKSKSNDDVTLYDDDSYDDNSYDDDTYDNNDDDDDILVDQSDSWVFDDTDDDLDD